MATGEKILREQVPVQSRTVLRGVPWHTYAKLRELPENYHLHMTYELVAGDYHPRKSSLCFPQLPVGQLQRALGRVGKVRETELIRGFRAWVRKNFVPEDD